jgi:lysylphosphatidylglycerol synthetase-like protein (DUF2156 family)
MRPRHSRYHRSIWHPLAPALCLVVVTLSITRAGLTLTTTSALACCVIWLVMSVYDRSTDHRLLDRLYGRPDE